jgi:ribosomal protein S18 acetylase RimI-like enzyme
MWVSPEFRRRGVGHSLVQQALTFLRSLGETEVSLWLTRGHDGVLAFYRAMGFRETGATDTLRRGSDLVVHELARRLDDLKH